ncbi:MAG: ABC transporter permease [Lachnospiraceae bacterium]|nr:ABC transporter permease [Lachnospiraceae bacterium]
MKTMIKSGMKLLFRTKVLWLFLIVMPVISTYILDLKIDFQAYADSKREVIELAGADEKVAYYGGKGEYVVKVYDASQSKGSDRLLENLVGSGLFTVCRAKIDSEDTQAFLGQRIETDGFEDRMGAALFLASDFDEKIENGNYEDALTVYTLSDDKRIDALESELQYQLAALSDHEVMDAASEHLPEKKVSAVAGSDARKLTSEQNNLKSQMGYAFSFMTLGFVFCGFFVANNAVAEQKNGVLMRINLSGTSTLKYFCSKFVCVFFISLLMTAVLAVCSLLLKPEDLGMDRVRFIGMIFMMGLIFSTLSAFLGIVMGDVMSASVAAFTLWCTSCLFSGVYFPLSHTSATLKAISFMMPQKWFLEGCEMIFVGDSHAFLMLICITAAYLAVILSMGSLGLKMKRA